MRAVFLVAAFAALAGCSSQADKQLAAVKSARSVLSEWALVEHQASSGRAPDTYTQEMRSAAREQLDNARKDLAGQPAAQRLIDDLRSGQPDRAALKRAADALTPLEDRLEAA